MKEIFLIIVCIMIYILYAVSKGYIQAYYYHNRNLTKENLHWLYLTEAVVVAVLLSYIFTPESKLVWLNIIGMILNVLSLGAIFPYFHDGEYYITRHWLDSTKYPLGWKDIGRSGNAWMNFNYFDRVGLLILGLALLIINNLILIQL
jgi:hypothetical protein